MAEAWPAVRGAVIAGEVAGVAITAGRTGVVGRLASWCVRRRARRAGAAGRGVFAALVAGGTGVAFATGARGAGVLRAAGLGPADDAETGAGSGRGLACAGAGSGLTADDEAHDGVTGVPHRTRDARHAVSTARDAERRADWELAEKVTRSSTSSFPRCACVREVNVAPSRGGVNSSSAVVRRAGRPLVQGAVRRARSSLCRDAPGSYSRTGLPPWFCQIDWHSRFALSASAPANELLDCVTDPPPPGLRTRTGTFVLLAYDCVDVAAAVAS